MDENYVCKIASFDELIRKWDYEIERHHGANNWVIWKEDAVRSFSFGLSIPYYGILNDSIICEATAVLRPEAVQNSEGMMDEHTVYLCAFRTVDQFRGKGYFSKLIAFLQNDLKQKGYTKAVLGVEPHETDNVKMYHHWGFTDLIQSATEQYPDGTVIDVDYYGKRL